MPRTKRSLWLFALATVALVASTFSSTLTSARSKPVVAELTATTIVAGSENIQTYTYKGKHSDWVQKLLTRVGGWKCPANASDGGAPPSVKAEECMRDKYVAAAVLYAWAAECYARQEEDSKAEDAAAQMYEQLKSAQGLCSDAPSFAGARPCDTEKILRCGEL